MNDLDLTALRVRIDNAVDGWGETCRVLIDEVERLRVERDTAIASKMRQVEIHRWNTGEWKKALEAQLAAGNALSAALDSAAGVIRDHLRDCYPLALGDAEAALARWAEVTRRE